MFASSPDGHLLVSNNYYVQVTRFCDVRPRDVATMLNIKVTQIKKLAMKKFLTAIASGAEQSCLGRLFHISFNAFWLGATTSSGSDGPLTLDPPNSLPPTWCNMMNFCSQ